MLEIEKYVRNLPIGTRYKFIKKGSECWANNFSNLEDVIETIKYPNSDAIIVKNLRLNTQNTWHLNWSILFKYAACQKHFEY